MANSAFQKSSIPVPVSIANGGTGSTTAAGALASLGAATTELDNLTTTAINTDLLPDTDITYDLGSATLRWDNIYPATIRTGTTAGNTVLFQAYDTNTGPAYVTLMTLTAGTTPTLNLDASTTIGGLPIAPSTGGGFTTVNVTGTSQALTVGNSYIVNNAGLVTLTLPATATQGDTIQIVGYGAGGWTVAQNASQVIHFGILDTTAGVGGSISSTHRYDCFTMKCVVANTDWVVLNSVGNLTVV